MQDFFHILIFYCRLAQQQETARKMSRQTPISVPTSKIPPQPQKPADLTSSLLQSNLTQLSKPQCNFNSNSMATNSSINYQINSLGNSNKFGMSIGNMGVNAMGGPIGNGINSPMGSAINTPIGSAIHSPMGKTINSPIGNTLNNSIGNNTIGSPMGNSNSSMTYGFQNQLALPSSGWNNAPNGNFNNKWANQANVLQDWSAFESLLPNSNENQNNNSKKINNNEMMDLLG